MQNFRRHICLSIVFVLALQILYLALDAPGAEPEKEDAETPGFNCIASCAKYVTRDIFHVRDGFATSKHTKKKPASLHKHLRPAPDRQVFCEDDEVVVSCDNNFKVVSRDNYAFRFVKEINPPPGAMA